MLSKKQMRRLINSIYGAGNQYGKQLERLYRRANRQIQGEISAFLSSQVNWAGKPSKDDLEDVRAELEEASSESVGPIVASLLAAVTLGHPKNGDVETARIALPMVRVAKVQHEQLARIQQAVPQKVARATVEQNRVTPELHRVPYNYDVMLQRQVSDSVRQRVPDPANINRNVQQTINRVRDVVKQASQSTDANPDWAKQVERIITGGKTHGGASGRARMIVRTQACHELNKGTIADFKARGVKQYRFMSLESVNSCKDCTELDGNIYDVDDAEEGVNLPPLHPNCQCWIVEYNDDDYGSGSGLEIAEDS
jgi:SPP1 gp7 family putative phage head morphogenesis protein